MCYKIEKQRKIEQKLAKELKDIPDFISDFLIDINQRLQRELIGYILEICLIG